MRETPTTTTGQHVVPGDLISFAGEDRPTECVIQRSGGWVRTAYLNPGSEMDGSLTAVYREADYNDAALLWWGFTTLRNDQLRAAHLDRTTKGATR